MDSYLKNINSSGQYYILILRKETSIVFDKSYTIRILPTEYVLANAFEFRNLRIRKDGSAYESKEYVTASDLFRHHPDSDISAFATSPACEGNALKSALSKITDGSSFLDLKELMEVSYKVMLDKRLITMRQKEIPRHEYEKLIIKVRKPSFERTPENQKSNTFDFIKVEVALSTMFSRQEQYELVKKYKKKIDASVISAIDKELSTRYPGVTSSFLKLSQCVVTQASELLYTFELKSDTTTFGPLD